MNDEKKTNISDFDKFWKEKYSRDLAKEDFYNKSRLAKIFAPNKSAYEDEYKKLIGNHPFCLKCNRVNWQCIC